VDREKLLLEFASRLGKATREKDWDALAALESELTRRLLPEVGQGSRWSEAERRALETLQAAHRKALEQCAGELSRLAAQLEEMRNNKDGWLAYAQAGDLEER